MLKKTVVQKYIMIIINHLISIDIVGLLSLIYIPELELIMYNQINPIITTAVMCVQIIKIHQNIYTTKSHIYIFIYDHIEQ